MGCTLYCLNNQTPTEHLWIKDFPLYLCAIHLPYPFRYLSAFITIQKWMLSCHLKEEGTKGSFVILALSLNHPTMLNCWPFIRDFFVIMQILSLCQMWTGNVKGEFGKWLRTLAFLKCLEQFLWQGTLNIIYNWSSGSWITWHLLLEMDEACLNLLFDLSRKAALSLVCFWVMKYT